MGKWIAGKLDCWKTGILDKWKAESSRKIKRISQGGYRIQVSGLIIADTNDLMLGAKATSLDE